MIGVGGLANPNKPGYLSVNSPTPELFLLRLTLTLTLTLSLTLTLTLNSTLTLSLTLTLPLDLTLAFNSGAQTQTWLRTVKADLRPLSLGEWRRKAIAKEEECVLSGYLYQIQKLKIRAYIVYMYT